MEDGRIKVRVTHSLMANPFSSIHNTDHITFSCDPSLTVTELIDHGCKELKIQPQYAYWFCGDRMLEKVVVNQPCGCVIQQCQSSPFCVLCGKNVHAVDLEVRVEHLHSLEDVLVMEENKELALRITCFIHLFHQYRKFTEIGLRMYRHAQQKSLQGIVLDPQRKLCGEYSWCISGNFLSVLDPGERVQQLRLIAMHLNSKEEKELALELEEKLFLDAENKKQYCYLRSLVTRLEYLVAEDIVLSRNDDSTTENQVSKYKSIYRACCFYEQAQSKSLEYFTLMMEHKLLRHLALDDADFVTHVNDKSTPSSVETHKYDEDVYFQQRMKELEDDEMHDILYECIRKMQTDTTIENHDMLDKANRLSCINNGLYEMMEWGGLSLEEALQNLTYRDLNIWWNSGTVCKFHDITFPSKQHNKKNKMYHDDTANKIRTPNEEDIDCYLGYSSVSIWKKMECSFGYNCFGVLANRTRLYTFDELVQGNNVELCLRDGTYIVGYVLKSCPHCNTCSHSNHVTIVEGCWETIPNVCTNATGGIRIPIQKGSVRTFSRDDFEASVTKIMRLDNYYLGNFNLMVSYIHMGRRLYPKTKVVAVGRVEPTNIGMSVRDVANDTNITVGLFLDVDHVTGCLAEDGRASYCGTIIKNRKDGYGEVSDYVNWTKKTKSIKASDRVSVKTVPKVEIIHYLGGFHEDVFKGYGELLRVNQTIHIMDKGYFHNNQLLGKGLRFIKEGTYAGHFVNGLMEKGCFVASLETQKKYHFVLFHGEMDKFHVADGWGTVVSTNRFKYEGTFCSGVFCKGRQTLLTDKEIDQQIRAVSAFDIDVRACFGSTVWDTTRKAPPYVSVKGTFKHVQKGDLLLFCRGKSKMTISIPLYPLSSISFTKGTAVDTEGTKYSGDFPRGTFVTGKIWFTDGRYREGEFRRKRFYGFEVDADGERHVISRGKKKGPIKKQEKVEVIVEDSRFLQFKQWLKEKRFHGKAIEMELAWHTIANAVKTVGNGADQRWWKVRPRNTKPFPRKAASPTSIRDYWATDVSSVADRRVWERLKLWREDGRVCSRHKKPMCCKTRECRFGKIKK